jgi:hypothetical protein
VQRFQDGTPDAPSVDLPDGSPYAGMDADVLAMLRRTLLAKTFWRWTNGKPTNLGAALDMLDAADINTLIQLKRRLAVFGLWANVDTIKGLWSTSSLGIDFNGTSMQAAVAASPSFCKDSAIGEAYHSGSCWREIVPGGTPGLHFCTPNSVHIDPHQTSVGRLPGIGVGGGGVEFGSVCRYSLISLVSHMMDVEGGAPVNIFTRYSKLGDRLKAAKSRLVARTEAEAKNAVTDLDAADGRRLAVGPTLREWSIRGFEGTDGSADARRVIGELDGVETTIQRAENVVRGIEASESPPPGLIYGP